MSESHTRRTIIDQQLKVAGWDVLDRTRVTTELDILVDPNVVLDPAAPYKGHQYADYALLDRSGNVLAVVEAKHTIHDAQKGQEQAKQYCENIVKQRGGDRPFCFYTNGHEVYFWDLGHYPPRRVHGYPTIDDLERWRFLRKHQVPLAGELIDTSIAGRDYQLRAIRAVMDKLEESRRKFLLVMATGTGKTRTTVALVDALMRAGRVQRTLFLVDRIALRDQALEAFKKHLPDEPRWPKTGETAITTDRRVYVSTYPTMLNVIRDPAQALSPHFFDLIIIDESHRSIYNTYGEITKYFNAVVVGLTATPTDVIDHNTFELFDCEDGVPTFAFSYEEAVTHVPPYLCGFTAERLKTKFQEDGIHKQTVSLEDQVKLLREGRDIADINYEGTELEKAVINRGTNALIVREFMEDCIKDPNGVVPGKTIFFCLTKGHARRMEEIFNALYPQYKGELARVIVSEDPRVHGKGGLLDQFKHNDFPRVAISVDMLDTGIDVRELVNLVFAKPVYSYTKFWQMIGRGTRLLEPAEMKPWCAQKDTFLILDCWDNFERFKVNPKGRELKPQIPLPVRLFGLRLDKLEAAIERGNTDIIAREGEQLRTLISKLPTESITIKDAAGDLHAVADPNFWAAPSPERIGHLRNTIQPLFRTLTDVDFKAMRFERDVVETSLAQLQQDTDRQEALAQSLIETIGVLPLSVNTVAREEDLIRSAQTMHFWKTATEDRYALLTEKIAPLMRYRDGIQRIGPDKLDLRDELLTRERVEFGPQHEAVSIARYRELVEETILTLKANNPLLRKLTEGQALSAAETDQLAEQLYHEHPHISLDLLRRVYDNRKAGFVQFIRHILGLEVLPTYREEVGNAFDAFIRAHGELTSKQLQFLEVLKNYLLDRQRFEKRDLVDAPFTIIHPEGILGLFPEQQIDEIVELAHKLVA